MRCCDFFGGEEYCLDLKSRSEHLRHHRKQGGEISCYLSLLVSVEFFLNQMCQSFPSLFQSKTIHY